MLALSAAQRTVVRACAVASAVRTSAAALCGTAALPAPAQPLLLWKTSASLSQARHLCSAQRQWATIAALSSGAGRAGIAVIRVSGPHAGALTETQTVRFVCRSVCQCLVNAHVWPSTVPCRSAVHQALSLGALGADAALQSLMLPGAALPRPRMGVRACLACAAAQRQLAETLLQRPPRCQVQICIYADAGGAAGPSVRRGARPRPGGSLSRPRLVHRRAPCCGSG